MINQQSIPTSTVFNNFKQKSDGNTANKNDY